MNKSAKILISSLATGGALFAGEAASPDAAAPSIPGYRLVWSDEFERDGAPDPASWNFEKGFVRNHEEQWYQEANAYCANSLLVIEARRETVENPAFDPGATGGDAWTRTRPQARYTSASLTTAGKREFRYGRIEVRARIPTASGSWPAIWTLGREMEWPSCGEIDIMEFYRIQGVPHILANFCWGTDRRWEGRWNSVRRPFQRFLDTDPDWASRFHVWRMDWDEKRITLFIDGEAINDIDLVATINGALGGSRNPFRQPHYVLLDLALGGDNGGKVDEEAMPMRFEIDYVRIYERSE